MDAHADRSPLATSVLRPSVADVVAECAALVWAFQEQMNRLSEEATAGEAFWRGRVPAFQPGASPSEELSYLLSLVRPDDAWLDIGAGAGRLAIPLAGVARRVVAVDASPTMQAALAEQARTAGLAIDIRPGRWPAAAADLPVVDVTLAANMLYAADQPIPFIEQMERQARRLCVVTLADRAPRTPDPASWAELFGEPLAILPGAREFVILLGALGRRFDVATFPALTPEPTSLDRAVRQAYRRYGLREGSPRMARLRQIIQARFSDRGGTVLLPGGRSYTAVISWNPPER